MAIHKLHIEDLEETEFDLIAIHSQLEDYKMAFMLNKHLPIKLHKCLETVSIKGKDSNSDFNRFEYEDNHLDARWNLVVNSYETDTITTADSQSLFADIATSGSTQTYFLPEFRKVDYVLKIENGDISVQEVVLIINQIDKVTAAYAIDNSKIRSKNNLIF
jgi:hypothetical protein